ncbi:alpha/beta hydrolase [Nocardia abscessus]|uniref:alpha/beta hydrolase n=1 Tax=Nocardia abscessus TaxID=120957 RepID=UPI002453B4D2|nr:alpha/beta hydrolase [Nocardia abscessus]
MRASVRARALRRISALTFRPVIDLIPVTPSTIPAARIFIDNVLRTVAPMLRDTVVAAVRGDEVRGEWIRGPRVVRDDAAILYVHGGGFVAGSARAYRGITSRLSAATWLPVFAVDYRLAPEHPFPAASEDVSAAYRWLLAQGFPAERIIVAGDSAGGYLAADFVITNAREGGPRPAALVLLCPMTDLSLTAANAHETAQRDGLLTISAVTAAIAHFTTEPRELRPRRGMSLPPTLIHAGDEEFFTGDATALAAGLHAAGASCELVLWPNQMHVFHVFAAMVPEARIAYRGAARFIDRHLDPATDVSGSPRSTAQ